MVANDKLFTSVNNTGDYTLSRIFSDNDTGDNDTSEQLSPVTTTPVLCFKKI
jgi:hypothetical protein